MWFYSTALIMQAGRPNHLAEGQMGNSGKLFWQKGILNYFTLILKSEEYLWKAVTVKKHLILKTSNKRKG